MSLRDVDGLLDRGTGAKRLQRRLKRAAELRLAGGSIPPDRYDDLVRLYRRASRVLSAEAKRLEAAGASSIRIADRRLRLAAVRRRLAEVQAQTVTWFRRATPLSYIDGYMGSLEEIGVAKSALGRINFAGAETIVREGLVDTATALEHSMDGLRVREAILTVTGEDIPLGLLEGKNSRVIARRLAKRLEDEFGFTRFRGPGSRSLTTSAMVEQLEHRGGETFVGFVDRANRPWSLERYTNMLARTKIQQTHRAGTDQYLQDNGLDLVVVSIHGATDSCLPFEGVELSRFAQSDGTPTVEQATAVSHLFGPNCKHSYTATSPRFRSKRKDRRIKRANAGRDESIARTAADNERIAREAA